MRERRKLAKKAAAEIMAFAATAYDAWMEQDHPIPDHVMKRITREAMVEAHSKLSYEARQYLSGLARR